MGLLFRQRELVEFLILVICVVFISEGKKLVKEEDSKYWSVSNSSNFSKHYTVMKCRFKNKLTLHSIGKSMVLLNKYWNSSERNVQADLFSGGKISVRRDVKDKTYLENSTKCQLHVLFYGNKIP